MGDEDEELQRSVFFWVALDNEGDHAHTKSDDGQTITAEEVARKHGVPRDVFVKHLQEEIEEAESCQSLPFTLLLVISYALCVISHDNAVNVNAVEDSVEFDIENNANFAWSTSAMGHKAMDDVNSHADFWSWMIKGFVPLIFQQGHGFAEDRDTTLPEIVKAAEAPPKYLQERQHFGMLLHYNRIVLGVRMRQERSKMESNFNCSSLESLQAFYDKKCVDGRDYNLEPEMWIARTTQAKDELTRWLYIHHDVSDVIAQLQQLERDKWLDESTKKIELGFALYNAEFGLHTLLTCNFFISRGGHIWKEVIPLSAYANWHPTFKAYLYDLIWICCLLWIIVTEIKEILSIVKESGTAALATEYVSFWNAVDWVSVYAGMVILTMFYVNLVQTNAMNIALGELGGIHPLENTDKYREKGEEYLNLLETEVHYAHKFKLILALYPLIIVFRLFKAFSSQPRLAVVTDTIMFAMIDLLHFLFVFMSVFSIFALAGVVLFGREVDSFTTMPRAIHACFLAVLGDFDWEALSVVGRVDAGLWFWTFMMIIVLLMQNILMAIVMDAYSEVKAKVGNSETLVEEFRQQGKRKKGERIGELVPMAEILKSMQSKASQKELKRVRVPPGSLTLAQENSVQIENEQIPLVTVDGLKKSVNNIRTTQAVELMMAAIMGFYGDHKDNANIDELLVMVRNVEYRTKKIRLQQKAVLCITEPDPDSEPEDEQPEESSENSGEGDHSKEKKETKKEPTADDHRRAQEEIVPDDVIDACQDDMRSLHEALSSPLPPDTPLMVLPDLEKLKADSGDSENREQHTKIAESTLAVYPSPHTGGSSSSAKRSSVVSFLRRMTGLGGSASSLQRIDEKAPAKVDINSVVAGCTVQLLGDAEEMLRMCHEVGVGPENDDLRQAAIGTPLKVLEKDPTDGTVCCRIDGVGDLWFAVDALARVEHHNDDSTTVSEKSVVDVLVRSTGGTEKEAQQRRVSELEQELIDGHRTVEEALKAVAELERRLRKTQDLKKEASTKFISLKKKAIGLAKSNKKTNDDIRGSLMRLEQVSAKRDEYHDLVKKMLEDNKKLHLKWDETKKGSAAAVSTEVLEMQIRQTREETQQARDTALDASQVLLERIEELIERCSNSSNVNPDIAKALRQAKPQNEAQRQFAPAKRR